MRSLLPSNRSSTATSSAATAAMSASTGQISGAGDDQTTRLVSALARLRQLNDNWSAAYAIGDEKAMARIEEAIEGVLAAMTRMIPLPTRSSSTLF